MSRTAGTLTAHNYPYVYGSGHAIQYLGAVTASGTVTVFGSTMSIQTHSGQALTFSTSAVAGLITGVQVNEAYG